MPIKLIVGLGNPGNKYSKTRHNVGFWFLARIASAYQAQFKPESKFFGQLAKTQIAGAPVWLLQPDTFMNRSGQSVCALTNFYKIAAAEVLVLHDELDIPTGDIRLKIGGGHGGHNGLRDISQCLGKDFCRMRIGIDHPGNAKQVADYVLKPPAAAETVAIEQAIDHALTYLDEIVQGAYEPVMNQLHRK